jgi:hypothetical protein
MAKIPQAEIDAICKNTIEDIASCVFNILKLRGAKTHDTDLIQYWLQILLTGGVAEKGFLQKMMNIIRHAKEDESLTLPKQLVQVIDYVGLDKFIDTVCARVIIMQNDLVKERERTRHKTPPPVKR